MEFFVFIIVVMLIGALAGFFISRHLYKRKYEDKIRDIDVNSLANEKMRDHEYDEKHQKLTELYTSKLQEAESILNSAKENSKSILAKAVNYAFNFETEVRNEHETAQNEIQKVLDDTYRYKRKTILSSISLKNYERKFEELKKERELYKSLLADRSFFHLNDNSDWAAVEKEFRDKVLMLQAAQEEKEAQAEFKRQMREDQQRAMELERQQLEAEERETALEARRQEIEQALLAADVEHRKELEETRRQLEQEIEDVHKQYERAKSMAQMTRQGHVYIISNIGSFGENVFKIGMTRRLEPLDRVSELSSASVPFEFDVHAMISCDDAPALENALHSEMDKYRVNKVNLRKEFFRTDIDSIIKCVEKHHGEVEYVANPAALQYNRSLEMEGRPENETELVAEPV